MWFAKFALRLFGWTVKCTVPDYPKCIVCVAPHTSNWDFVLGEFAWWSLGRRAGFLMKDSWFFFPMGLLLRAMGGIPVARGKGKSLTPQLISKFSDVDRMTLAIAPEGTRAKVAEWHTGFLRIAVGAKVPVILGAIDAKTKTVHLEETFVPTGDIEADMAAIRAYYAPFVGINAENS
ncbi:MAG: 1-acyl-sn-glycerol-3-phosphate acyltransferase [Duncaniella sp.]|nr:1-acyl-sn-glycerol-3-phosphate acyltransferase [Duncaniella sp.]